MDKIKLFKDNAKLAVQIANKIGKAKTNAEIDELETRLRAVSQLLSVQIIGMTSDAHDFAVKRRAELRSDSIAKIDKILENTVEEKVAKIVESAEATTEELAEIPAEEPAEAEVEKPAEAEAEAEKPAEAE